MTTLAGDTVTDDDHRTALARPALWVLVLLILLTVAGCGSDPDAREAELVRGEQLYDANCAECHGGATGGDITDIPPPHNAEGHTWHHPDCELIEVTLHGAPPRPGDPGDVPEMPAFEDELTEEDVEAILAHIKTWWTAEQREFQDDVTEQACP